MLFKDVIIFLALAFCVCVGGGGGGGAELNNLCNFAI